MNYNDFDGSANVEEKQFEDYVNLSSIGYCVVGILYAIGGIITLSNGFVLPGIMLFCLCGIAFSTATMGFAAIKKKTFQAARAYKTQVSLLFFVYVLLDVLQLFLVVWSICKS